MLQPLFIQTVLCDDQQYSACLMLFKYSAQWDPLILVKWNAVNITSLLIIFKVDGNVFIQFADTSHI